MFGNKNKVKVKKLKGYFPNGDRYEYYGETVYNMMHGRGTQTLLEGPVAGSYIIGDFYMGRLTGGTWYNRDGSVLEQSIESQ